MPTAFVPLKTLPLTPHGKVDRQALPAPRPPVWPAPITPQTATEAHLATLWADVHVARRMTIISLLGPPCWPPRSSSTPGLGIEVPFVRSSGSDGLSAPPSRSARLCRRRGPQRCRWTGARPFVQCPERQVSGPPEDGASPYSIPSPCDSRRADVARRTVFAS